MPLAPSRFLRTALLMAASAGLAPWTHAQDIVVTPLHASGLYSAGEKMSWRIAAPGLTNVHAVVKRFDTAVLWEGPVKLDAGRGLLETSLDAPGTVLVTLDGTSQDKRAKCLAGAAAAALKILPSAPRPADFDAFWQAKIKELHAVPPSPALAPGDSGDPAVEYVKLTLDNIRGAHVYGQLARPKRDGTFPALLIVQWAGVYGLPKSNVVNPAKNGWLALNIMAHDLPFDQPEAFYKKAAATALNNYTSIGNDDRETSYFLRMLLGCYRAADYLTQRPDWDGRVFVVTGTSQGGLQGLATAGLHPNVTAVLVNVPAGCDTTAPWAGRSVSWPYWFHSAQGKDEKKVMETSRYFDGVNFAANIRCPALVALGLIDQTSCPAGVFAAFNQILGPKEAVVMVSSEHRAKNNSQSEWDHRSHAWLEALVKGAPAPLKTGYLQ